MRRAVGEAAPISRSMSASSTSNRHSGISASLSEGGTVVLMPKRYMTAVRVSVNRQSVVSDEPRNCLDSRWMWGKKLWWIVSPSSPTNFATPATW